MSRYQKPRSGITILEVMIAMGIALFGLLAVMAIVPFAATQAQQGLETEDVVLVGQRAIGDVHAYDMLNPERWITLGSTAPGNPTVAGSYTAFRPFREPAYSSSGAVANDAFFRMFWDEAILIDPLFFFSHVGDATPISHFPYTYAPLT
ncbi:MAG: hypothetical protein KDA83_12925, partial [Planctomycetales bacterium]|nr:hypothetical protein [Planctomycetales bacterium]